MRRAFAPRRASIVVRVAIVLPLVVAVSACSAAPVPAVSTTVPGDDMERDAGGDTAPSTEPTGRREGDAEDAAACLIGSWQEDMTNLLAQWQNGSLSTAALPVTGLDGQNALTVTESSATYAVDYTANLTGVGDAGMRGETTVSGASELAYAVRSPTELSLGPVVSHAVNAHSRVYVGDELMTEQNRPWDNGMEGTAVWWCDESSLSLQPEASGWIHLFTRTE